MDIHKPKAAHSWREFLVEIGTITCGIAIALLGEQAVEAMHWRHVAEQTVEQLKGEAQAHVNYAAYRTALQGCVSDRITHLRDKLAASKGDWASDAVVDQPAVASKDTISLDGVMPTVIRLPFYTYRQQSWDTARANTALGHLDRKQLDLYTGINTVIGHLALLQTREQDAALELAPLAFDGRMSDDQRARHLQALARMDDAAAHEVTFSKIMLMAVAQEGLHPNQKDLAESLVQSRKDYGACVH